MDNVVKDFLIDNGVPETWFQHAIVEQDLEFNAHKFHYGILRVSVKLIDPSEMSADIDAVRIQLAVAMLDAYNGFKKQEEMLDPDELDFQLHLWLTRRYEGDVILMWDIENTSGIESYDIDNITTNLRKYELALGSVSAYLHTRDDGSHVLFIDDGGQYELV